MKTNKILGGFLILEGIGSILFSGDAREISQFGRLIRIGIGTYVYSIE
jgi:hypothetical protein